MSAWTDRLRPASFRGVPFAVLNAEARFGRRLALHEYPFRDNPWAQDMGRRARVFTIRGFLITDSAVYGGGDVIAQRERFVAAVEAEGSAQLIHPTYGDLTVALDTWSVEERWDAGQYFEFNLTAYESGDRVFPNVTTATPAAAVAAADDADLAISDDFDVESADALSNDNTDPLAAVKAWTKEIRALVKDATAIYGLVTDLAGSNGRYAAGRTLGFLAQIPALYETAATIGDLIGASATARAVVGDAESAVETALGALGGGAGASALAAAVRGWIGALAGAAADPSDRVRVLLTLTSVRPPERTAFAAVFGDLLRTTAATALVRATAVYEPSSYDDAATVKAAVSAALDAALIAAADAGRADSYKALRALSSAALQDLTQRGAKLAPLRTVTLPEPIPALALAQRLYRDPNRAEQLVTEADPIHPLFMPTAFRALAA